MTHDKSTFKKYRGPNVIYVSISSILVCLFTLILLCCAGLYVLADDAYFKLLEAAWVNFIQNSPSW